MTAPTAVQRRAGTAAEHVSFIGLPAELTVDETDNRVVVHDGATPGGHPMAKESEIAGLASLASPTFTGTPAGPTAAPGTDTTQLATTAFVRAAVNAVVDTAPGALDTLNELAAALGDDANFASTVTSSLAAKAPLASPALTGNPTTPTQATSDTSSKIASTAFVKAAIADAGGSDVEDLTANQDFMATVLADLYGNYLGMARGWSDAFDTEDGIDTTASANESYSAAGDYYEPTSTGGAISGATGTNIGNMTSNGGLAAVFNGVTNADNSAAAAIIGSASGYVGKTHSSAIAKVDCYGTNNFGYDGNGAGPTVTLTLYGKTGAAPANATDGTSLGSITFTNTANESTLRAITSSDTTTVFDHRWATISHSGTSNLFIAEAVFYAPVVSNNMGLISNAFAAPANVGMTAAFLDLEFGSALTAGTDFDFAMTSAGTPSYTSTGASYSLWYSSGNTKRYLVEGINLSAQADDAVRARFRTLTNKAIKITGWRPRWEDA